MSDRSDVERWGRSGPDDVSLTLGFWPSLTLHWDRRRSSRVEETLDVLARQLGQTVEEVVSVLGEDTRFADVVERLITEAARKRRADHRRAMARVVANAANDDAKIDEAELALDAIARTRGSPRPGPPRLQRHARSAAPAPR